MQFTKTIENNVIKEKFIKCKKYGLANKNHSNDKKHSFKLSSELLQKYSKKAGRKLCNQNETSARGFKINFYF